MQSKNVNVRDSIIPDETVLLKPIFLSSEENGVIYSRYREENYRKTSTDDKENILEDYVSINMRKHMLHRHLQAS